MNTTFPLSENVTTRVPVTRKLFALVQAILPAFRRQAGYVRSTLAAASLLVLLIAPAAGGISTNSYVRLDPTFNGTGKLSEPFFSISQAAGSAMAIQPDGKIVIARRGLRVARYNADGSADTTFGGGSGKNTITEISLEPAAIAFQADGKIVIGGQPVGQAATARLVRLNADGTLDASFGTAGTATWPLSTVSSIVIQPDGKIVSSSRGPTGTAGGVSRHNANGTLDNSFAGDGVWNQTNRWINAVTLQNDGKVIAAGGNSPVVFAVFRLEANGVPDMSFGTAGEVVIPGGRSAAGVCLQPDGKIAVAGTMYDPVIGSSRFGVVRLASDGVLDPGFGNGGIKLTKVPYSNGEFSHAIYILPDGKLLVGGYAVEPFADLVFQRYNPDGSLDTTFDLDGRSFVDLGGSESSSATAVDAQGRMVTAALVRESIEFVIARSAATPTAARTLFDHDGDGRADLSVWRPGNSTWYTQTANSFLFTQMGVATDKIVPADYDGDGKSDIAVWSPSNGEWKVLRSESQTLYTKAWGETGDLPVPFDAAGDGQNFLMIYRPSTSRWWFWNYPAHYSVVFGMPDAVPVRGDFDGDAVSDLAFYGTTDHTWRINRTSGGTAVLVWGEDGDIPVPADYDGDGATDIAVWRPSTGKWWIIGSTEGWITWWTWGEPGDKPVPADYDGDGRTDVAVWRPSNGTWYIANSSDFSIYTRAFGESGDIPIPAAFIY